MIELQKAKNDAERLASAKWVKWIHEGSAPAETSEQKNENVIKGTTSRHCAMCLNLNGCCFVADKSPSIPLHEKCHCYAVTVPPIDAQAQCLIEKFTEYVFVPSLINDKKQLFELLGYDIMDSQYLQQEFIKQAKLAYSVGNYELGLLNEYGQRINIPITLKRKNKNEFVTFRSGWMVYPNGRIVLTTPYGGRKRNERV